MIVPDPIEGDIHSHAFQGTVDGFHGIFICIADQENNVFDIEADRLEIVE